MRIILTLPPNLKAFLAYEQSRSGVNRSEVIRSILIASQKYEAFATARLCPHGVLKDEVCPLCEDPYAAEYPENH